MDDNKRKELWEKVRAGNKALTELHAEHTENRNRGEIEDVFLNTTNWPILLQGVQVIFGFLGGLLSSIFGWNIKNMQNVRDSTSVPKGFFDTLTQIWNILNLILQYLKDNSLTAKQFQEIMESKTAEIREGVAEDVATAIPGQLRRMGGKIETKLTFEDTGEEAENGQ